jgi:O-antigen/teichoic acid export membrane protein
LRQSTVLIVNTFVTYGRMAVTVGLGLTATRLLMQTLGFVDFGLLNVLGAGGVLVTVLLDAMTSGAQRHLAYEIGRKDSDRLRTVYNTTLGVFLGMALLVLLIGAAVAPILPSVLTIPVGRDRTAQWVFFLMLLGMSLSMIGVPFAAIAEAHQAMVLNALRELATSVLNLVAVLLLKVVPGDHLLRYGWMYLAAQALTTVAFAILIMRIYPECRPRPRHFCFREVRNIVEFAAWTTLWTIAWRLRMQGSAILLNLRFGPLVNSADAIACQVAMYQNNLGQAVYVAARPAAVSLHARGDRNSLNSLVLLACKYPSLILLFVLIPVQIEAEGLLQLWLKQYPPLAPFFVRVATVWMAMLLLSRGFHLAMMASGNLGRYTIIMAIPDVLVLIAGTVAFYVMRLPATALPIIALILTVCQVPLQAWYVGRQIHLSLRVWLARVVQPVIITAASGGAAAWAVHRSLPAGLPRLVLVAVTFGVVALPCIWLIGLESWEQQRYIQAMRGFRQRVRSLLIKRAT